MRIAYLTAKDPNDRRSWSGTQFYMARALEKHCGELFCVGPLPLVSAKVNKVVSRGLRTIGVTWLYTHTESASRKLGKMAEAKLAKERCDVIFAPAGSILLAHLRAQMPVVYLSDATFRLMADYYPEFTAMSMSSRRAADRLERLAIEKAQQQVYPSSWAARSAVEDYGADPASVHVVPFGANVEEPVSREVALTSPAHDKCRMLFVGREWGVKGGELAFETLVKLERLGVPAQLTIVGCRPPDEFRHPNLRVIPFLNKNIPEQRAELDRLYLESHCLLLPSRAECFSIALCEANSYGLPIISTHTGGLPELVREGVNGFLLPLEARGEKYAARIKDIYYSDPAAYQALRTKSRDEFETRLNWDAWGKRLKEILAAAIARDKAPADKVFSA